MSLTEGDALFRQKIERSLQTVRAWEDTALLAKCRATIPYEALRDDRGPHSRPEDRFLDSADARFVQRLCRYFKDSMTWVNNPPCSDCDSKETTHSHVREAQTPEEIEGEASRVEVYDCKDCNASSTVFPRYNSVRTLLETRRGRCGEYANLFGLYCRASGLSTRYILDFTDHVWTEVFFQGKWAMLDGCEGVMDEPSMYEKGWGKKLSYVIALAPDHVLDVTSRYSRQLSEPDMLARRRSVTSSEAAGQQVVEQINNTLRQELAPKVRDQVEKNCAVEIESLHKQRQLSEWESDYAKGRISGSLEWKLSRNEAGSTTSGDKGKTEPPSHFVVESFLPSDNAVSSIAVQPTPRSRHEAILVSRAPCAVDEPNSLSVVVVDQNHPHCILQARSFSLLQDFGDFVDTLPDHRIVAVHGALPNHTGASEETKSKIARLGGFDETLVRTGVMFLGHVGARPDWAHCASLSDATEVYAIELPSSGDSGNAVELKLRTHRNTKPARVVGRVPESIMPLQTQLLADYPQKRQAFLSLMEAKRSNLSYSGYTTKPGSPIYLLGANAYPFEVVEPAQDHACWNTFVLLPSALVPDDDMGIEEESKKVKSPTYEVPVDSVFFTRSIGNELLVKANGSNATVPTTMALHNARLVGLYFSAHWCGPCRSFTPVLAEMYQHLKSEFPSHGLEIVFVSSDRDAHGFDNYYRSMPWLAVPFSSLSAYKQLLSMTYEVRGIPAFVVLDAMTGQVVVSTQASRREVMEACSRGEAAIESLLQTWLQRLAPESLEIIQMLEMSCVQEREAAQDVVDAKVDSYLTRIPSESSTREDTATQIKSKFAELVKEGLRPNEAAAKAIQIVSSQSPDSPESLPAGPLDRKLKTTQESNASVLEGCLQKMGKDEVEVVLNTIVKYLENAKREPWNPKFRSFKLSNKVVDRIVHVPNGLELLGCIGLDVSCTIDDFVIFIPLEADTHQLHAKVAKMLENQAT